MTATQQQQQASIAAAARALETTRSRWLNPPELVSEVDDVAPGLPKRKLPRDEAAAKELASRTITKLYNKPPAWLTELHRDLDRAVLAAYGWPEDLTEPEMLGELLKLNLERADQRTQQGRLVP